MIYSSIYSAWTCIILKIKITLLVRFDFYRPYFLLTHSRKRCITADGLPSSHEFIFTLWLNVTVSLLAPHLFFFFFSAIHHHTNTVPVHSYKVPRSFFPFAWLMFHSVTTSPLSSHHPSIHQSFIHPPIQPPTQSYLYFEQEAAAPVKFCLPHIQMCWQVN